MYLNFEGVTERTLQGYMLGITETPLRYLRFNMFVAFIGFPSCDAKLGSPLPKFPGLPSRLPYLLVGHGVCFDMIVCRCAYSNSCQYQSGKNKDHRANPEGGGWRKVVISRPGP